MKYTIPAAIAILTVGLFYAAWLEQGQWEEFKQTRSCKVVGKLKAQVIMSSKDSMIIPEQTEYLCDDGAIYRR